MRTVTAHGSSAERAEQSSGAQHTAACNGTLWRAHRMGSVYCVGTAAWCACWFSCDDGGRGTCLADIEWTRGRGCTGAGLRSDELGLWTLPTSWVGTKSVGAMPQQGQPPREVRRCCSGQGQARQINTAALLDRTASTRGRFPEHPPAVGPFARCRASAAGNFTLHYLGRRGGSVVLAGGGVGVVHQARPSVSA